MWRAMCQAGVLFCIACASLVPLKERGFIVQRRMASGAYRGPSNLLYRAETSVAGGGRGRRITELGMGGGGGG